MDNREKVLYHQIHPAKLGTDIAVTLPTLALFWWGNLLGGILATLPSLVASALVMRYANLERIRDSAAGAYLRKYMTPAVQAVRFGGLLVMILGAWYHVLWPIAVGLLVILFAWFRGFLLPAASRRTP